MKEELIVELVGENLVNYLREGKRIVGAVKLLSELLVDWEIEETMLRGDKTFLRLTTTKKTYLSGFKQPWIKS